MNYFPNLKYITKLRFLICSGKSHNYAYFFSLLASILFTYISQLILKMYQNPFLEESVHVSLELMANMFLMTDSCTPGGLVTHTVSPLCQGVAKSFKDLRHLI